MRHAPVFWVDKELDLYDNAGSSKYDLSPAYLCHRVTSVFLLPAMAYLQNKVIREVPVLSLFSAIALQTEEKCHDSSDRQYQ